MLSQLTISFELHAKVAEETDVEVRSYGQLSEVQMLRDLDLTLDRVQITSSYTVQLGLPASLTT